MLFIFLVHYNINMLNFLWIKYTLSYQFTHELKIFFNLIERGEQTFPKPFRASSASGLFTLWYQYCWEMSNSWNKRTRYTCSYRTQLPEHVHHFQEAETFFTYICAGNGRGWSVDHRAYVNKITRVRKQLELV